MKDVMRELARLEQEDPMIYLSKALHLIADRKEQGYLTHDQECEVIESICLHLWEVLP